MICKDVSYNLAIDEWSALLDGDTLSADQARSARAHLAGLKAEKEMAYQLDAHLGGRRELLIFNNLKFAHRDLTAQIDHLVLSRWSAYFIETKSVSQKININSDGQWARVYGKKYVNMESPLEQSRRHETLLFELLESRLPDFMGKMLGFQKNFRGVIDIQHLIAVSVGASIQGRGKKAIIDHIRPLDQIPRQIADNHGAVRASLLGSVIAEMRDSKTRKRDPVFGKQELDACRKLILEADISSTPLEQVHDFMESLAETPVDAPEPEPPEQSPAPRCPKCDSPMVLRKARRGDRAGKQFYGCSRYPKCRTIINVD